MQGTIWLLEPTPFDGDSDTLDLGSNGQARYTFREHHRAAASWKLLGFWRPATETSIEVVLEWEEISWSPTGRVNEGMVESVPEPNAAFPLERVKRLRLRAAGDVYTMINPPGVTSSHPPGRTRWAVRARLRPSMSELADYFRRAEFRPLRDESMLR
jgi:hypothetical protein